MPGYWLFRSRDKRARLVVAKDPASTEILAALGGEWNSAEEIEVHRGEKGVVGAESTDLVIERVERDGYFVWPPGQGARPAA